MKLFAVYVGGEMKGANVEVHDMRFVIGNSVEDTYPELRRQWWGTPSSLHIDCWSELSRADGYSITLSEEPSAGAEKLYYLNLGGYDSQEFTEMHKNIFVVAENESKAKVRGLKTVRHWNAFHKDDMFQVEQSFCVNGMAEQQALYIHLSKIADETPSPFICRFFPIGKSSTK